MNKIEKDIAEIKELLYSQSILQKENLTFEEGCSYTNTSSSHMYKLTCSKKIPHFKNGRQIWFKKSELDTWLLRNRVKTIADIENEAATRLVLK